MTESFLWRTIIVDAVVRKCEAKHGDVTVVADTWTVLGITEDELANLVRRRQLSIKSKHIAAWLKPHSFKITRGGQFR